MQPNTDKPLLQEYRLYIKNMVCNRCILVVKDQLEKLGIQIL